MCHHPAVARTSLPSHDLPLLDGLRAVAALMVLTTHVGFQTGATLHGSWVGAAVARHVQPVKLDGNRLIVEVDDPAWATQLRFLEDTLRSRLREVAGAEVDTIDVRVTRG